MSSKPPQAFDDHSVESVFNSQDHPLTMNDVYVYAVDTGILDRDEFSPEIFLHYPRLKKNIPASEHAELDSWFAMVIQAYEHHRDRVLTPEILDQVQHEQARDAQGPMDSSLPDAKTHLGSLRRSAP